MLTIKEKVCSYRELNKALILCNHNVRWKDSVLGYDKNRCANLTKLHESLMNGTYKIDPYITFTVCEPKKREIVATRLKDRVFQRSLCNNYLYDQVTKSFIYDNCACQKGKGTDFARNRLSVHLQRFFREHEGNGYVLKIDVKNFFGSTNHEVAKSKMAKLIDDEWAKERVFEIIDSFKGDTGIGLGSQISQLTELALLNDIDHAIKEQWKIKHYLRYMDDIVVIHESKEKLIQLLNWVKKEFAKLKLEISEKKTYIAKISQPIKFLGFRYSYTKNGKVIKRVLRTSLKRAKAGLLKQLKLTKMTLEKITECFHSFIAHISKGNNYKVIQKLKQFYKRRILTYEFTS